MIIWLKLLQIIQLIISVNECDSVFASWLFGRWNNVDLWVQVVSEAYNSQLLPCVMIQYSPLQNKQHEWYNIVSEKPINFSALSLFIQFINVCKDDLLCAHSSFRLLSERQMFHDWILNCGSCLSSNMKSSSVYQGSISHLVFKAQVIANNTNISHNVFKWINWVERHPLKCIRHQGWTSQTNCVFF